MSNCKVDEDVSISALSALFFISSSCSFKILTSAAASIDQEAHLLARISPLWCLGSLCPHGLTQPLTNFRLNHVTRHNARSLSYSITWVHTAHHKSPFLITYAHSESDGHASHINPYSTSRYFYLITLARTTYHDYHSFVAHTGCNNSPLQSREPTQCITIAFFLLHTQGITILLFQTDEPTQRITITILLLPTQCLAILLFQRRELTQRITITFLLSPTQGITNFPLSITWAHTAHNDYFSFVTYTGHHEFSSFNHVSPHSASRLPFFCCPHSVWRFSFFNHVSQPSASRLPFFWYPHRTKRFSSFSRVDPPSASPSFSFVALTRHNDSPLSITWAHTAHHGYSYFVESRSPTQGITDLFFASR